MHFCGGVASRLANLLLFVFVSLHEWQSDLVGLGCISVISIYSRYLVVVKIILQLCRSTFTKIPVSYIAYFRLL